MPGCRDLSRIMTIDARLKILTRSNVTPAGFYTPQDVTIEHVKLVGVTGFEPATSWSQTTRSTKLSYTPIKPADEYHASEFSASEISLEECLLGAVAAATDLMVPNHALYQAKLHPVISP
jgi:hypothetical protein